MKFIEIVIFFMIWTNTLKNKSEINKRWIMRNLDETMVSENLSEIEKEGEESVKEGEDGEQDQSEESGKEGEGGEQDQIEESEKDNVQNQSVVSKNQEESMVKDQGKKESNEIVNNFKLTQKKIEKGFYFNQIGIHFGDINITQLNCLNDKTIDSGIDNVKMCEKCKNDSKAFVIENLTFPLQKYIVKSILDLLQNNIKKKFYKNNNFGFFKKNWYDLYYIKNDYYSHILENFNENLSTHKDIKKFIVCYNIIDYKLYTEEKAKNLYNEADKINKETAENHNKALDIK